LVLSELLSCLYDCPLTFFRILLSFDIPSSFMSFCFLIICPLFFFLPFSDCFGCSVLFLFFIGIYGIYGVLISHMESVGFSLRDFYGFCGEFFVFCSFDFHSSFPMLSNNSLSFHSAFSML
jgi:hypothetical protein